MAKYKQEVKDKCVAAAKKGMHLKQIQQDIGPNPKATMRYLAKEGIDYKDLLAKLKADGKLPQTETQKARAKQKKDSAPKNQPKSTKKGVSPKVKTIVE